MQKRYRQGQEPHGKDGQLNEGLRAATIAGTSSRRPYRIDRPSQSGRTQQVAREIPKERRRSSQTSLSRQDSVRLIGVGVGRLESPSDFIGVDHYRAEKLRAVRRLSPPLKMESPLS